VSKKFADILAAYNVQIHQLTPNSIPQVLKFPWACRTFAGDNDMDTFVRHFEIHWVRKLITVDDEEKEAQYGCCTFQMRRPGKNQAPVELAPATRTSGLTGGPPTGFMLLSQWWGEIRSKKK
jgi:hypothetical protein